MEQTPAWTSARCRLRKAIAVCSLSWTLTVLIYFICKFIYFWLDHAAYGVFVPLSGIKPVAPAVEKQTLNYGALGGSLEGTIFAAWFVCRPVPCCRPGPADALPRRVLHLGL